MPHYSFRVESMFPQGNHEAKEIATKCDQIMALLALQEQGQTRNTLGQGLTVQAIDPIPEYGHLLMPTTTTVPPITQLVPRELLSVNGQTNSPMTQGISPEAVGGLIRSLGFGTSKQTMGLSDRLWNYDTKDLLRRDMRRREMYEQWRPSEYQPHPPREYYPSDYEARDYENREYRPREYQLRTYQTRDYPPREYQYKAPPPLPREYQPYAPRGPPPRQSNPGNNRNIICHYCGNRGHVKRFCRTLDRHQRYGRPAGWAPAGERQYGNYDNRNQYVGQDQYRGNYQNGGNQQYRNQNAYGEDNQGRNAELRESRNNGDRPQAVNLIVDNLMVRDCGALN